MKKILVLLVMLAALLLVLVPAASAEKMSGTITLDQAAPAHGDTVTFTVTTSGVDRAYLIVNCYQDGAWVLAGQGIPSSSFTLASGWWTSGPGECTATIGSLNPDATRYRKLASVDFAVT